MSYTDELIDALGVCALTDALNKASLKPQVQESDITSDDEELLEEMRRDMEILTRTAELDWAMEAMDRTFYRPFQR